MRVVRGDALLELGKNLGQIERLAKEIEEKARNDQKRLRRRIHIGLAIYALAFFLAGALAQWLIFG